MCEPHMQPAYVTSNFLTTRILHNNREAHTRDTQKNNNNSSHMNGTESKKKLICVLYAIAISDIFFSP